MEAKILEDSFDQNLFDSKATHFVQSWLWGEVRKQTGVKVIRVGFFEGETLVNTGQISLHAIPKTGKYLGLLSRGAAYAKEELDELVKIGQSQNAIAIRIEPDALEGQWQTKYPKLKKAPRNYYIPHNFLMGLTQSEEELLAHMHSKTRYNIKVAQKHGVTITEETNAETLEKFIALQKETAQRQKFYLHPDSYYKTVFEKFHSQNAVRLLVAKHPEGQILSIWFLVLFKKTMTYLYGASSDEHRHMMANNLLAWHAMQLAKQLGMETFDFGGTLGLNADEKDPRYGFHRFKEGFGGKHVSYVGTYDLVISPLFYTIFTLADTLRWQILRLKK